MLSILYILHHCNTLQSLGGNLPNRALVRCGCARTCLLQRRQHRLWELLGGPGCSAKQQDGSSRGAAPFLTPIPISRSASPTRGEGWPGIAAVAVHTAKLFLVIQRGPEIRFPLCSIPFIASKASGAGEKAGTGLPPLRLSPQAQSLQDCPTAWAIPRAVLCQGVTEQTEFNWNPSLDKTETGFY